MKTSAMLVLLIISNRPPQSISCKINSPEKTLLFMILFVALFIVASFAWNGCLSVRGLYIVNHSISGI